MSDYAVHKASDLAVDERLVVERWLGCVLSSDETISVNAYCAHPAPNGNERETLWLGIMAQADEIGSRAAGIDEQEVDELLDEAFAEIRSSHD
jgi:hypothetical protein